MLPWQKNSFLVDLKPNSNSANLFVCCFDEDKTAELSFKLKPTELEICPVAADEKMKTSCFAHFDAIQLQADSLANCSWSDLTTFQAKLTVDSIDSDIDVMSTNELADVIKGRLSLRKFCDLLKNTNGHHLQCKLCKVNLLKQDSRLSKFYALPSENWQEVAADWFCHNHGEFDEVLTNNFKTKNPASNEIFLNDDYFLINCRNVSGVQSFSGGQIVTCKRCGQELGKFFAHGAEENGAYQLYHYAVILAPMPENGSKSISFIDDRFGSVDRWLAWSLLSNSEEKTTLKFCIKTLDNHPQILIWLLDSYSVFLSGKMRSSNETKEISTPYPVLKLLYKVYDESTASDPRATGEDCSVAPIFLPVTACHDFIEILLQSTKSLPVAYRHVGQFYVGYLKLADKNTS